MSNDMKDKTKMIRSFDQTLNSIVSVIAEQEGVQPSELVEKALWDYLEEKRKIKRGSVIGKKSIVMDFISIPNKYLRYYYLDGKQFGRTKKVLVFSDQDDSSISNT